MKNVITKEMLVKMVRGFKTLYNVKGNVELNRFIGYLSMCFEEPLTMEEVKDLIID